MAKKATDTTTN